MTRWAILTGEYPPQAGGVADYTRLIARGLAEKGDDVTVFAPYAAGEAAADPGVSVRRLPDHFGPRGLFRLDAELRAQPRPDRILVQYVPHAFGQKAMNVAFVAWLASRARRVAPLWVMFHEVMYPIEKGQPWRHAFLGRVTRAMARRLVGAAERVFVSIPAWDVWLRSTGHRGRPAEWLPVPSNVAVTADARSARRVRDRIASTPGTVIIGHFGAFGEKVTSLLAPALAGLLRQAGERIALLIGRNGTAFREQFVRQHADLVGRVTATGDRTVEEVAAYLAACDVLLQPYPDGASCRRTSLMAGLALGVPTVTNRGFLSEPVWGDGSPGVTVAPSAKPEDLMAAAETLLGLPETDRRERGKTAAVWYQKRFSLERTIERLRPAQRPAIRESLSKETLTKAPWVIVSAGFHFAAGQAKAVAWLAEHLANSGVPVHLVGNSFDARLVRPGIVTHPVPAVPGADLVGNLLLAWVGRAVCWRITRRNPGTRVIVNGGNCTWGDANWVHYVHRAWQPDLTVAPRWFRFKERLVGAWYRRAERRALQAARVILANSRRTAADVIERLEVPAERVRTIYLGADPVWAPPSGEERQRSRVTFGLPPDRPVITFLGGLGHDNRKGIDTLLAAWERLAHSSDWDAELVLAGGGKASAEVARRLQRNGLDRRVRMLGFTTQVFELLAATDLLVSPARYEPYGLNVHEAICRGVPALVSACAGVAEEYPPELAEMLLPDPEDDLDLANRLRNWRRSMAEWKARFRPLSEKLRARTWGQMAEAIIRAVLESKP